MHDPKTVAFEIENFFVRKDKHGYRPAILTIYHNDPEKDGTDDSCGWFIRLRHTDKNVYEKIVKEFESEWDSIYINDKGYVYSTGWFHPDGTTNKSVQGIVFNMYLYAAKIALVKKDTNPSRAWEIAWRFMRKQLVHIMYFAENNRDSLSDTITRKFEIGCDMPYSAENRMSMIRHCATVVYTDILRTTRKWYQHPRWHIHHWSLQFHPIRNLKRRYWDKCSICGKRGFKGSAMSDWDGTKIWHQECDRILRKPSPPSHP